jgi:hypothetical protein
MTQATDWLSQNSSSSSSGPGVHFGTVGDKVIGQITAQPKTVETEFGQRLLIELLAADGCTAAKGARGGEGPITAGDEITLWVKPGAMATALKQAITEAGATGISEGDTIAMQYSGDGVSSKAGWNPPKLYNAKLKAAKPTVNIDDLL